MARHPAAHSLSDHCTERPKEPQGGRRGVSPTFKAMIEARKWKGKSAVDVGCGSGAATLLLAGLGARTVGVDIDPVVLALASSRAEEDGLDNARFVCADAEAVDFRDLAGEPKGVDGVVAHLCFSDVLAKRAAAALKPGGVFVVRSFEKEMWKEAGEHSPFAFTVAEMRAMLTKQGLKVERIEVERRTQRFNSFEDFMETFLEDPARRARWQEDGRLQTLQTSFRKGNRKLTEAFLVLSATKEGAPPKAAKKPQKARRRPRKAPS